MQKPTPPLNKKRSELERA